ncbi:MAG: hypothetical protein JSS36_04245 [Proteobacteria bacterium]|nr:hypothetical protein [Pseudomonadota bacterium]
MNLARKRPGMAALVAGTMAVVALLVGYLGLSAYGYLVPAVVALICAALVWQGRLAGLVRVIALVSMVSGTLLVLVLALGDGLGDRKLDISAVALLVNLATGGPATALVAPLLLLGLRPGRPLATWFA